MLELCSFCGRLFLINSSEDLKKKKIVIKIVSFKFDTLTNEFSESDNLKLPPELENVEISEFVFFKTSAVNDARSWLKNFYFLFVSKPRTYQLKLFRLVNFKSLKLIQESTLPESIKQCDSDSVFILDGPCLLYTNSSESILVNPNKKFTVLNQLRSFKFLRSRLKCGIQALHIYGTCQHEQQSLRDSTIIHLVIHFHTDDDDDPDIEILSSQIVSSHYASIITCMYFSNTKENETTQEDDVFVSTSRQQLLHFKDGKLEKFVTLPSGFCSDIVEFVSSTGTRFLFVKFENNKFCSIFNADNFELLWNMKSSLVGWSVLVDDFINYGFTQVLVFKISSSQNVPEKSQDLLSIIDNLDGAMDVDSVNNDYLCDKNAWSFIITDFSGIQIFFNLSEEEKHSLNICKSVISNGNAELNEVPRVILDVLQSKLIESHLELEQIKKQKRTKMTLINDAYMTMTKLLSNCTLNDSLSQNLVSMFESEKESIIKFNEKKTNIGDNNDGAIEKISGETVCSVEIIEGLFQTICRDRLVFVLLVRNKSKHKKVSDLFLFCIPEDEKSSKSEVKSYSFVVEETVKHSIGTPFTLYASSSQKEKMPTQAAYPDYVCSKSIKYQSDLLYNEECYITCSTEIPIFQKSEFYFYSIFLQWNEVDCANNNNNNKETGSIKLCTSFRFHVKFDVNSLDDFLYSFDQLVKEKYSTGKLFAILISSHHYNKLRFSSSNINLSKTVAAVLIKNLKFVYNDKIGFFLCCALESFLSGCYVSCSFASFCAAEIHLFTRTPQQQSFFVNKFSELLRYEVHIENCRIGTVDSDIDQLSAALRKEVLHRSTRGSSVNEIVVENNDTSASVDLSDDVELVKSRNTFEKKRRRLDLINDQIDGCLSQHFDVNNFFKCQRETDLTLSRLLN